MLSFFLVQKYTHGVPFPRKSLQIYNKNLECANIFSFFRQKDVI